MDGNYVKGGIIEEVKIPQKKNYLFNIKEYMKNSKFVDELDGNKRDRNCLKHCFILAIHDYFDKYQN